MTLTAESWGFQQYTGFDESGAYSTLALFASDANSNLNVLIDILPEYELYHPEKFEQIQGHFSQIYNICMEPT